MGQSVEFQMEEHLYVQLSKMASMDVIIPNLMFSLCQLSISSLELLAL